MKYIAAAGLLAITIYVIAERRKRNKMYETLMDELKSGNRAYGNVQDLDKSVFSETFDQSIKQKGYGSYRFYNAATTNKLSEELHDELTAWFGIDEDDVYSIFSKMPSQAHVNNVAIMYRKKYGRELSADLMKMGEKDARRILDLIKSKPKSIK
jgi:hypothetical protein